MSNLDAPAGPVDVEEYDSNGGYVSDSFGLTKREQACITLLVPESGDEELDELIRKSRRQKMASDAMNGWLARCANVPHHSRIDPNGAVECALDFTDELIKQLESE